MTILMDLPFEQFNGLKMPIEIIPNLIGIAALGLTTIGPWFSRKRYLLIDTIAILLYSIHWKILGADLAAACAFLGSFVSLASVSIHSSKLSKLTFWILVSMQASLIPLLAGNLADYIVGGAAITKSLIKGARNFEKCRFLIPLNALIFAIYGVSVGSYALLVFGIIGAAGHFYHSLKANRIEKGNGPTL